VRLLLDTHAFLWFVLNDAQLSVAASALITNPSHEIEISPATYWEIAIKISLGKYSLSEPLDAFMEGKWQPINFVFCPSSRATLRP